ncbi:hypothetical protein O181_033205 [Austropuccinia psidii MF-1]|uniref:Uncharacterized protein n=1 Tax=Austropuccinia psidii MF-1 TaxID=1389203 RepID=A0A9Q3D2L3_9BASI|nr:hypothetical protein [Austropuccinia psidii MF-1]
MIIPVPSSIDFSTPPLLAHHPMVISLLDCNKVIVGPMKDGNGKRTFKLGLIVTMCYHPWDSNLRKTPWQPTPGPNDTSWLEDLFPEPSQHDEQPIPGPSQPSEPHEDASTREPEPEVTPTQSTKEPFGKSPHKGFHSSQIFLTPPSPILSFSHYTCLRNHPQRYTCQIPPSPEIAPIAPKKPTASSPQPHNEARQEFTNFLLTLMIPETLVHETINQILLEHHQLLQMILFVDATHRNEMHCELRED